MLPLPQMQSAIPLLLLFSFFSSSTLVWYKDRLNWTIAPCFGVEGVDIHPPSLQFRFDFRVTGRLGDSKLGDHPLLETRPVSPKGRSIYNTFPVFLRSNRRHTANHICFASHRSCSTLFLIIMICTRSPLYNRPSFH